MYSHIFFDHNLRRKEEEKKIEILLYITVLYTIY